MCLLLSKDNQDVRRAFIIRQSVSLLLIPVICVKTLHTVGKTVRSSLSQQVAGTVVAVLKKAEAISLHYVIIGGTVLQAGMSLVRVPMRSSDFSVDLILPAALGPLGSTRPLTEMSTRNLPGVKGGRRVRLTTLPPSVS
jgi:hypothetical protein